MWICNAMNRTLTTIHSQQALSLTHTHTDIDGGVCTTNNCNANGANSNGGQGGNGENGSP
jgi:hypothetical protein